MIKNLNKFILNDFGEIELGKDVYKIPTDLSVYEILNLQKVALEVQNDPEKIIKALDIIWEIIKTYNPEADEANYKKLVTMRVIPHLVNAIIEITTGKEVEQQEEKEVVKKNSGMTS